MQSEQLYCSAASIWELTIKAASGRLELPELFVPTIAQSGVRFLDVTVDHARAITNVSLLHKDPFDRLLLAQVLAENLAFMTADTAILSTNQPFLIDARQ
jgi:PIN domain nuclease of toxin-antitoxin system